MCLRNLSATFRLCPERAFSSPYGCGRAHRLPYPEPRQGVAARLSAMPPVLMKSRSALTRLTAGNPSSLPAARASVAMPPERHREPPWGGCSGRFLRNHPMAFLKVRRPSATSAPLPSGSHPQGGLSGRYLFRNASGPVCSTASQHGFIAPRTFSLSCFLPQSRQFRCPPEKTGTACLSSGIINSISNQLSNTMPLVKKGSAGERLPLPAQAQTITAGQGIHGFRKNSGNAFLPVALPYPPRPYFRRLFRPLRQNTEKNIPPRGHTCQSPPAAAKKEENSVPRGTDKHLYGALHDPYFRFSRLRPHHDLSRPF